VQFRAYDDDDLWSLVEVFTASVHQLAATHYDAAQRDAWALRPADLEAWRERLAALIVRVADDGAALQGVIGYTAAGHVDLLFTAPTSPRLGVARRLYASAEADLRARGVVRVTTDASLVAEPFFARQGFVIIEPQQVTRGGIEFRRYAMGKDLPAR